MFRKNKKNSDNGDEIARPDPYTKVRTTAAKTETTNTTVQTATIINENSRTVSYQTTRQTVTHQQQARITEINTIQYSPGKEEIEKFLAELNIGDADPKSSRLQQMLDSTQRLPPLKTENTTVTQKSGSKMTSMIEERRIRLNNGSFFDVKIDEPNRNASRKNDFSFSNSQRPITSKVDAQPFSLKNHNLINQTSKYPLQSEGKKISTTPLRSTSSVPSITSSASSKSMITPSRSSASSSTIFKGTPRSIENTPTRTPSARELHEIPKIPIFPTQQERLGAMSKTSKLSMPPKSSLKPGFAYIFNNENFDNGKNVSRVGTDADAKALVDTFKMFNLTVEVHKDATLSKIKSIVKAITNRDFKRHSCLVIAILTHGSRNETVQARDKAYSIDDDVLFPIMKNLSLSEKPKILFIQACKGFMEVEDFHRDQQPLVNGTPAEILKCYSTFEGYVSYRTEQGTFFIQKLCEELKKNGKTESIEVIMKSVTAAVKQFTGGKQIPTMTVNLTEPFIFGDYI